MARPQKSGLDYFALDVNMSDEVEIIEAEHGLVGFAILIKLYQKIYSEGYFYEWGDKEQILFSNRVSVDRNTVVTIVDDCIKWNIFDSGMYEKYNILTSRRMQNHYITAVYKRVNVEVVKEYLLIDVSERNNLLIVSVNGDTDKDTSIVSDISNEDTIIVSDDKSTQSKVKESKGKESILKQEQEEEKKSCSITSIETLDNLKDNDISKVAIAFQQNGFGSMTLIIKETLIDLTEKYTSEWVNEAMKVAVKANIRTINYVEGILRKWNAAGGMKLESDKKTTTLSSKHKTRFHNFKGRTDEYTSDQLESVADRKRREHSEKLKKQKEGLI